MSEQRAMSASALVRGGRYLAKVAAITGMDMRKLRHDPTELLTRAIQPMLWLLVFGQVFARTHGIPTGGIDYLAFLAPGILAQSVLFVAIFNGISVIWERDLGIVHKFLASPTPRTALVLGKALAAGMRGADAGRHRLRAGGGARRAAGLGPAGAGRRGRCWCCWARRCSRPSR